MSGKITSIGEFLTVAQIKTAQTIWKKDRSNFHKRVLAEVVEPHMKEINRKLGQENNAGFIAYAIEYIFSEGDPSGKR